MTISRSLADTRALCCPRRLPLSPSQRPGPSKRSWMQSADSMSLMSRSRPFATVASYRFPASRALAAAFSSDLSDDHQITRAYHYQTGNGDSSASIPRLSPSRKNPSYCVSRLPPPCSLLDHIWALSVVRGEQREWSRRRLSVCLIRRFVARLSAGTGPSQNEAASMFQNSTPDAEWSRRWDRMGCGTAGGAVGRRTAPRSFGGMAGALLCQSRTRRWASGLRVRNRSFATQLRWLVRSADSSARPGP